MSKALKPKLIIFDLDDTLFFRLPDNFTEEQLASIKLYPGVKEILQQKDGQKVLVSKGEEQLQREKLRRLGIMEKFDSIMICAQDQDKKKCFEELLKKYPQHETWVIGDRIDVEIKFGNQLGFKTVRIKRGKYQALQARDKLEIPNYEVNNFKEVLPLLNLP